MLCCHFFSHACTTTAAPAEATCCLVMLWRVIAKRTLVFCCLFKVERCLCLTPTHSLDLSCLGDCDNKAACASISLRIKQLKRQSTWGQRRAARMNKNKTKQPPPPQKKMHSMEKTRQSHHSHACTNKRSVMSFWWQGTCLVHRPVAAASTAKPKKRNCWMIRQG